MVASRIRTAGPSDEYRPYCATIAATGRWGDSTAACLAHGVIKPLLASAGRLKFALDDTPTERSGRRVQVAEVHHNPCPEPAGSPFVYGHVWVVLWQLAVHSLWRVVALPLLTWISPRKVGSV